MEAIEQKGNVFACLDYGLFLLKRQVQMCEEFDEKVREWQEAVSRFLML